MRSTHESEVSGAALELCKTIQQLLELLWSFQKLGKGMENQKSRPISARARKSWYQGIGQMECGGQTSTFIFSFRTHINEEETQSFALCC